MRSIAGAVSEAVLKGDAPAGSADARVALAEGLSPREAELLVHVGKNVFRLLLEADTFGVKRAKLPDTLQPVDRMGLLEQLDDALRRAFLHFLQLRTSPAWEAQTLPAMATWLVDR
jgi:hypothetical protein